MNFKEAHKAIQEILNSIPDSELPKFKVKTEDGRTCLWLGGMGRYLGSAKDGKGNRNPIHYRENGATEAIIGEAVYRADLKFLNNGDNAKGLKFNKEPK